MFKVCSAFKLLFYASRLLGFAPYTLLENGKLAPSRNARRYSIILCSIVIAAEMKVFAFEIMTDKPILIFGMLLLGCSSVLTHVFSVLISIKSPTKFIKIAKKLKTLDSIFHQTSFVRKKQLYTLIAQLVIGGISLGSYVYWAGFCTDDANIASDNIAAKFICFLGDYIIVLQYINFVLFSRQYFHHFNARLLELERLCSQLPSTGYSPARKTYISFNVTSPKPASPQFLDQILTLVELYNKLLDTVRSINSAYSLQILFIIAKMFFHIIFCLYLVFIVIFSVDYDKQYNVHALFFILWTTFQLFSILASCDCTKREVSMDYCCKSGPVNVFKYYNISRNICSYKPLRRQSLRYVDNIQRDLGEIVWGGMD
jgi:hypothetical protein